MKITFMIQLYADRKFQKRSRYRAQKTITYSSCVLSEMPETLFEVWSFQNMTMKLSRWHRSPIIRKALKKIIAAQGRGGASATRRDRRRAQS